jgi:hypothetical protein
VGGSGAVLPPFLGSQHESYEWRNGEVVG